MKFGPHRVLLSSVCDLWPTIELKEKYTGFPIKKSAYTKDFISCLNSKKERYSEISNIHISFRTNKLQLG